MKYEAKLEINGIVQPEGDNASDEINLDVFGGNVAINGIQVETNGSFGGGAGLLVRPVSSATGKPWVRASRNTAGDHVVGAEGLCASLGTGYDLINNSQWQAVARNIESVSSNFDTSGAEADHAFNHGHADIGPADTLAADTNDANGCFGIISNGDPDDDCGGVWHINKRTHSLTNGEVIWDLSGNVSEWVRDDNNTSQGSTSFIQEVTYTDPLKWGPANGYSAQTGTQRGGLGRFFDGSAGAVSRGGFWFDGSAAGLFYTSLTGDPSGSFPSIGFRCVFAP